MVDRTSWEDNVDADFLNVCVVYVLEYSRRKKRVLHVHQSDYKHKLFSLYDHSIILCEKLLFSVTCIHKRSGSSLNDNKACTLIALLICTCLQRTIACPHLRHSCLKRAVSGSPVCHSASMHWKITVSIDKKQLLALIAPLDPNKPKDYDGFLQLLSFQTGHKHATHTAAYALEHIYLTS